jgi:succinylglutamic semialdehyde dehydrogenase
VTGGLGHRPADYIGGRWVTIDGAALRSTNPAQPQEVVWAGSPAPEHVGLAVAAARSAFPAWAALDMERRAEHLRRFEAVVRANAPRIAELISDEMGKTLEESRAEARLVADKVRITLGEVSMGRVREYETGVSATRAGRCRFKPHGVMAVIGPFNFPLHLPNGHWVPALAAGNTVVHKPSEKTPAVGQLAAELMNEAGLPAGVFNVVQGGPDVAAHLVRHRGVDGILFTGSWPVGRSILEANLNDPGRIVALEMGGNNPAAVMADCHLKQAILECVRCAFATTGQRCTATRRIILDAPIADRFIPPFCKAASTLVVGPPRSPEPVFMGPLVSETALRGVVDFERRLESAGGRVLVPASRLERPGHFLTPSVVLVDGFPPETDCEVFGPLVQIAVARGLGQAIEMANATRYGLAAAIFTSDRRTWERFFREVRAGCINLNTGTSGASSALPFGGLGCSGNHRPAGAFCIDSCACPVATLVEQSAEAAVPAGVGWDDAWL